MAEFLFDGKKVYYEIHGKGGRPLVILNGIMMSTASWQPFVNQFSKNNQVILVDFFDQGQSQRLNFSYTHDLQVELLNELIERLWYCDVTLMGISYGGEIALQYALKYPQRVNKLILANTCARTSSWLKKIGDGWNAVASTGDGLAYYLTTIPIIYSTQFFHNKAEWMDGREKTLTQYFSRQDVLQALIRLTNSSVGYDVVDKLCQITCPTLVISGSEDALVPPTEQQLLHQKIPNSVYVTINGSGHASMYENPLAFLSLVLGFTNTDDVTI